MKRRVKPNFTDGFVHRHNPLAESPREREANQEAIRKAALKLGKTIPAEATDEDMTDFDDEPVTHE